MLKKRSKNKGKYTEDKGLLKFLKSVKKGKLGNIEQISLRYSRIQTQAESINPGEFFYSLS